LYWIYFWFVFLFIFFFSFIYLESASFYLYSGGSCICYGGSNSSDLGKPDSFGENSVIELELNMMNKTLHFFLNKKQLPYVIENITSSPLCFGISSCYKINIEIISLLKLNEPTTDNNITCSKFEWK
jgi:hypothetical protein